MLQDTKNKTKKREYIDFDLDFIYNNMYLPMTRGEDIKTSKTNKGKFLTILRRFGKILRRYNKVEGTSYVVLPRGEEDKTITMSKEDIQLILSYYPLSETNLVDLYFRLLETNIDPSIIEYFITFRDYVTNSLGYSINQYKGELIDLDILTNKKKWK